MQAGMCRTTGVSPPKLTVNFGLRMEYEFGRRERYDRAIAGFDPAATAADHGRCAGRVREEPDSRTGGVGIFGAGWLALSPA